MPHITTKPKHITAKQLLADEVANDLGTWILPIKMRSGKEGSAVVMRNKRGNGYSATFRFPTTGLKFSHEDTLDEIVKKVNEFIDIANNHDLVYVKKMIDS